MGKLSTLLSKRRASQAPEPTINTVHDAPLTRVTTTTTTTSTTQSTINFLSLPPEVRNQIYSIVARSTSLSHKTLPKFDRTFLATYLAPGLLLASRQIAREYEQYLWSSAAITVAIRKFDFRGLIALIASLYARQLKAMRRNDQLTIQLVLDSQCTLSQMTGLRRWAVQRATCLDQLPWDYDVVYAKTSADAKHRVRCLESYADGISSMMAGENGGALDESTHWELQPVMKCVGRELEAAIVINQNLNGAWV